MHGDSTPTRPPRTTITTGIKIWKTISCWFVGCFHFARWCLTAVSRELTLRWSSPRHHCSWGSIGAAVDIENADHTIVWSSSWHRHSWINGQLSPLLTNRSSEPAIDNAATARWVAQLTDHWTAAALYIATVPTSPYFNFSPLFCYPSKMKSQVKLNLTPIVFVDVTNARLLTL